MINGKKGSLTIFLALSMLIFMTFCLVLTEGVRFYFLRTKAAQAMELAQFSVLSEYQYDLLKQYGVFFLDLDYEQGSEKQSILEQRFQKYLSLNAEEIVTADLITGKFQRATDNGGQPFFEQAVELMKVQSGYKVFEEITGISDMGEGLDLGKILEENTGAANTIMNQYRDEDGKPLFSIALPNVSFPSIRKLTEAIFGSESMLSDKTVDLKERLLYRNVIGESKGRKKMPATDMQLFHAYLFEHFGRYGDTGEHVWKNALEYQLEYIIAGKESDQKNLENIMWRIFLMRAGGNYLFYHQDPEKIGKAEAEAMLLVGITGNPDIINCVKEILLIAQAIEEGIQQTKSIFAGAKLPLYQNDLLGNIQMGYEEYLYLFLNTTDQKQKIYRSMDVTELEIRKGNNYSTFCLDHCVAGFLVEWCWQAESIFEKIPFLESGVYENIIRRNVFYAR